MTFEEKALLTATIVHFQEIARQNRFPENGDIPHDRDHCAVCHPELIPQEPFLVYLEVITEAIKARRPLLDEALIRDINTGLEATGEPRRISMVSVLAGEPEAVEAWAQWAREAVATGLGLLSIHSDTSLDFDIDDEETMERFGNTVENKVREIMQHQTQDI